MFRRLQITGIIIMLLSAMLLPGAAQAGTTTFSYTGAAQSWTVPAGVTSIQVNLYGAQGGGSQGGYGGWSTVTLAVTPGENLTVNVGGRPTGQAGGWNGGGAAGSNLSQGGGGASDIKRGTTLLAVAGGGGGEANGYGGPGGGLSGSKGGIVGDTVTAAGGGTQTAGGAGGIGSLATGSPGVSGTGGAGASHGLYSGGGGGGGYFGGGGGGIGLYLFSTIMGGGGGGSSYINGPGVMNASTTGGEQHGHGQVIITTPPSAPTNPNALLGIDKITWLWYDTTTDATGYKVYDDPGVGPPTTLQATLLGRHYYGEWIHLGLSVNTQYAFQVAAFNGAGDSPKSSNYTAWTNIESVSSLTFSGVTDSSIGVASTNTPSNLAAGESGLCFRNVTEGALASSGWQQNNTPWTSSGLTPNTWYNFYGESRNGGAVLTSPPATGFKYTLAGPPSIGNNVTCDRSVSTPYTGTTTFTFSNPAGFGVGSHGGSAYKATKFKYVWNANATHTFTGSETDWSAGTLAKTQTGSNSYYLHLQSYNADGAPGGALDYGPFILDNSGIGPESDVNSVYWDDQFRAWGATNSVYAMARFGGTVYIGGAFTAIGGVPAKFIAKWDGTTWSALGTGMNDAVNALAVDASGNLYAGGRFTNAGGVAANYVAKWNGTSWSALGSGVGNIVGALGVNSAGVLYVGGWFTTAGGAAANRVAKWDGAAWSALGVGTTAGVRALRVDSSGNVYFGGGFNQAGGITVNRIARWNAASSTWSALGSGVNADVYALALDSSNNVYVSGTFMTAGGSAANLIARWNGSAWSAMGAGTNGSVTSLAVDASNNVFAGGLFSTAGGTSAINIARWNGSAWSALGSGVSGSFQPYVNALLMDASGNLLAGGDFLKAGGAAASYLAKWTVASSTWSSLPNEGLGVGGNISTIASDGSGNVYAGGYFTTVGSTQVNYIAKWNSTAWSALGTGMDSVVLGLKPDSLGNLYAVGDFTYAGGVTVNHVGKWNGSAWSALGSGTNGTTWAAAMDPSGNLYIGGAGSVTGGVTTNYVAKWNGSAWSALGTGMNGYVYALAADQSGNLYAGGAFTTAGGVTVNRVAKWNGSAWSALGTGTGGSSPDVCALAVDDQGNLYAGGGFTTVGGVTADHVAKWNGTSWSALNGSLNNTVTALAFDSAGSLYVGGQFTTIAGASIYRIAKWNGSAWSTFGVGLDGTVAALTFDRNVLFAGGDFGTAGGKVSARFGIWQPRVNRGSASFAASPGAVTLGNDIYGFHKPALTTDASTTVTYSGGLPVTVSLERANEIHVGGKRVNGAFKLGPEGVQFGGSGATLRIEFSEEDAALYGAAYDDFRAMKLAYPADYPANKEAAALTPMGAAAPVPIRIENGKQIYAITVPFTQIGSTYGAVPCTYLASSVPTDPAFTAISADTITWTWQDNSDNETGFKVYADPDSADPTTLQTTTAPNAASWQHTGLTPNTLYAFQVCATNAAGDSAKTATITKHTLVGPPSIGQNAACDKTPGILYPASTVFTFSNPAGFGAGTHGGSVYRVSKFKYVWDTNATHVFTGVETDWTTGAFEETVTGSGSYYLHVQSFNAEDAANATTLDYGPFLIDADAPIAAAGDTPNVDQTSSPDVYAFTILYIDETAIQVSTLDNADIRVTGPNGYDVLATFVSSDPGANADLETATYVVTPPGGTWDLADEGVYTISLESNQVTDTVGNPVASDELGGFLVDFAPVPLLSCAAPEIVNSAVSISVVLTEPSADFTASDIQCSNAAVSDFTGSGASYAFNLVPVGTGVFTFSCSMPGGVFTDTDGYGKQNLAGAPISRTCDNAKPAAAMASTAAAYTKYAPIPVTVTFTKDVMGFELADIAPGNATAGDFVAVDAAHYSFALTPLSEGAVTAAIAADVAQDNLGNTNTAAPPFSRIYDITPPTAAITRVSPATTSANTLVFRVIFDEPVAPTFTPADLTSTGTLWGAVNISGGPSYTVSITPADANADGTVSFSVGTEVTDLATNAYAGGVSPVCTVANWHGIVTQPQPVQQYTGGTKTLSVEPDCAAGTEIAYQWKYDDGAKAIHLGPTTSTWDIDLIPASNGSYWCEMTYDGETHESDHVTIRVADPLTFTPGVDVNRMYLGGSLSMAANASGGFTPLAYQWSKNGSAIGGATDATYDLASVTSDDAGAYSVTVTDDFSSSLTSNGSLAVAEHLSLTDHPVGARKYTGENYSFATGATGGFTPLHYQWQKDGVDIAGATNATLAFTPVALTNAGAYRVVVRDDVTDTWTTTIATLDTADPLVVALGDPPIVRVYTAENHTLAATVTGGFLPLTQQWAKDGTDVPGATDTTCAITGADSGAAGSYVFRVADDLTTTRTVSAQVLVADHLEITADPVAAEMTVGQSYTFSVATAGGFAPLAYQWTRNGVAIADATDDTLVFASIAAANEGNYACRVTDLGGDVLTSASALLHVAGPLAILQPPVNVRAYTGESGTFTVESSGGFLPIAYQWRKDGVNIEGATQAGYSIGNAATDLEGGYSVVITDAHGASVTSDAGMLEVANHLQITQQPLSGTVNAGSACAFSVAVTGGFTPIEYQWKKDGTIIDGATDATYAMTSAALEDEGAYSVDVMDAYTDIRASETAILEVSQGLLPVASTLALTLTVLSIAAAAIGILALAARNARRHNV